jgi:hypothetical protein
LLQQFDMSGQRISVTKKRGRPSKDPTAVVRLPLATIEAAETWAAKQSDEPSRPEAIRRLIEKGLGDA